MQSHQETKTGGEFHKLTQLEGGEKYTLLLMSDFGIGAIVMQITLAEVKVSSYAQYAESVQLTFKPKRQTHFAWLSLLRLEVVRHLERLAQHRHESISSGDNLGKRPNLSSKPILVF